MQPQERLAWHQPAFAFEASQDQYEVLLVFVPPFEQTNFLLAGGGIKQMMLTVLISTCNRPASSNDELGHSIYISDFIHIVVQFICQGHICMS